MAKFEEALKKATKRPETNMQGSFDCQYCGEYVTAAFYEPKEKVLVWWCSQNHMSSIEEIVL